MCLFANFPSILGFKVMQRNAIKIRTRMRGNDKKNETKDKVDEGRIKREGKESL